VLRLKPLNCQLVNARGSRGAGPSRIRTGQNRSRRLQLVTSDYVLYGGPKEVRAWTVRTGAAAPEAAGVIHPDFEKGFIRAEIIECADLVRLGSEQAVKDNGLLHVEGIEYLMEDGDIVYFRFNV